ncbi:sensor histidine kinase [Alicyclobacillus sp. SO9]|uniref:sensor histidine kinase n=1 Tax=Alicyclobacillus sp. SO9 TaxID=2665646 RepID=UPI0018E9061A|nr:ATP-binding protein [Alicyclobacillus sp. SO9]QQE79834.1 hypothetical protein GI364_04935 [Alicyclobacillus sp. SO9]
MTLGRTRWLLFIVPAFIIGTFETIRHTILENILPMELGNWITALIDAIVIAAISKSIIQRLHQAEREVHEQQRVQAIAEERKRLASVLHDEIAQSLFYSGVHLSAAKERAEHYGDAELKDSLDEVILSLRDIDNNVRQSIFNLKNDPVGTASVYDRFRSYLDKRLTNTSVEWELDAPETLPGLSESSQVQLFSILQEAITNVVKHANASHIKVALQSTPDAPGDWTFLIEDDGIGIGNPKTETRHFGLEIMAQRAHDLGAAFSLDSPVSGGTVILIRHDSQR